MSSQLELLFEACDTVRRPPPLDLAAAIAALPPVDQMLPPWETWTLIGLVRHRQRQLWVGEIVTTRLHGRLADLAVLGAFGHPDQVPQQGPVPGLPEWEYYFHGGGCCLTNRVTGESIDVDFFEDSAEYFDVFFYENYLKSLRSPELPEWRLLELHRSVRSVRLTTTRLLEAGALARSPGCHAFRVTETVLEHSGALEAFFGESADPRTRLWHAALVGDWLAAQELAPLIGEATLSSEIADRAEHCRGLRRQQLMLDLRDDGRALEALLALDDLDAEELPAALAHTLKGPPSGLVSAALDIIRRRDAGEWCDRVYRLIRRIQPGGPAPEPHIWMASLKFLLRHGHRRDEMLAALCRAGGYELGEACLLALEHAPQFALPLLRRTLCSGVPANRSMAAAVLALIDRPWSRRELLAALEASDDQEQTADCRAALLECHDEAAHRAVQDWEARNPHESEAGTYITVGDRQVGPCFSFQELSLRHRSQRIRYEMEQLHDRVMRIRDCVPPEPAVSPKPWWKFW